MKDTKLKKELLKFAYDDISRKLWNSEMLLLAEALESVEVSVYVP